MLKSVDQIKFNFSLAYDVWKPSHDTSVSHSHNKCIYLEWEENVLKVD